MLLGKSSGTEGEIHSISFVKKKAKAGYKKKVKGLFNACFPRFVQQNELKHKVPDLSNEEGHASEELVDKKYSNVCLRAGQEASGV